MYEDSEEHILHQLDICLLTPGEHYDGNNQLIPIDSAELARIAEAYNPALHEAPIVLGHDSDKDFTISTDAIPAYGWLMRCFMQNGELWGTIELIDEAFGWLQRKLYKHRSIGLYKDDSLINPLPGVKYPRHIALLGAQPPAIKGMPAMLTFSEPIGAIIMADMTDEMKPANPDEEADVTGQGNADAQADATGEGNADAEGDANATPESFLAENAVPLLQYIIGEGESGYKGEITRFEPEPSADNNWLWDDATGEFKGQFVDESLGQPQTFDFVVKQNGDSWELSYKPLADDSTADLQQEQPAMPDEAQAQAQPDAQSDATKFAEANEVNALRQELAQLRKEKQIARRNELNAFAEGLYKSGKLTEGQFAKADLVAILASADEVKPVGIAFAEGESAVLSTKLIALLNVLEPQVQFGEMCKDDAMAMQPAKLSAPAGTVYDPAGEAKHNQIVAYCEANGMDAKKPADYRRAMKAVG